MPWKAIIRGGLVFGVFAGIFGMAVELIAALIGHEVTSSMTTAFVSATLGFLIIGGAGQKIGTESKNVAPAWRLGALAGALGEVIRTVGASAVLSIVPAGQALFARLTPAEQRQAQDPAFLITTLAIQLVSATLFGALLGWLGAWAALRFGPPKTPRT
jgi:hypothetical protein